MFAHLVAFVFSVQHTFEVQLFSLRCPSIPMDEKSTMPTMCLLCGAILCSQSYCCQRTVRMGVLYYQVLT